MIRAIVFDFGQTLVDSSEGFRAAEKEAQEKAFRALGLTDRDEFIDRLPHDPDRLSRPVPVFPEGDSRRAVPSLRTGPGPSAPRKVGNRLLGAGQGDDPGVPRSGGCPPETPGAGVPPGPDHQCPGAAGGGEAPSRQLPGAGASLRGDRRGRGGGHPAETGPRAFPSLSGHDGACPGRGCFMWATTGGSTSAGRRPSGCGPSG